MRLSGAKKQSRARFDWAAAIAGSEQNAGGIQAFYFKDPDGHALEILQFPEGKGDAKWHRLAKQDQGKLFLGIDHTAIVVSDTDASLKFYRDALGMRVAGESENYGIEQERLNNVFGARPRMQDWLNGSRNRHWFLEDLLHTMGGQRRRMSGRTIWRIGKPSW